MIIARAPLRVSFVGGGTDLPDFYHKYKGKVISTTIDKYVYIVVNRTPLIQKVSARYSISESVNHSNELQHTRIKAALLDMEIEKGIEIASFASLPSKTGLGSSSSFSVALIKALNAYTGKRVSKSEAAEAACHLEIDLVGEPIGKQDQYAAAFGGFNVFQFNSDDSVNVEPVLLDYKSRLDFENHLLFFFTGIERPASSVLTEQKSNIDKKFNTLKEMSDSVDEFLQKLLDSDYRGLGTILHNSWLKKKSLASNVSNSIIDDLYNKGIASGAWGGKILGAGGGGCLMFIVPLNKKVAIRKAINRLTEKKGLKDFQELPIKFVQSGAEILYNADYR